VKIVTPAKLNIFLKVVGFRGEYHEISSRFIRYEELSDTLHFLPAEVGHFTIEGFPFPPEENIIYRAYRVLAASFPEVEEFFRSHKVVVEKRIPMGGGLGGGSSNGAGFIELVNRVLRLGMGREEMAEIGVKLGADLPFFISGYRSANVGGIGEIIEPFDDEVGEIELKLLHLHCETGRVYRHYRQLSGGRFERGLARKLEEMTSNEILATIEPLRANDLFGSAVHLCPELGRYSSDYFLSGSGSTLFRSRR